MRKIWLVLASLFAVVAFGANVSFIPPTKNTDGSSIPVSGPGSLTGSSVAHGACVNDRLVSPPAGTVSVPAGVTSATVPDVVGADTCVEVRVTNTFGRTSDPAAGKKVFVPPTPQPPTGVAVTQSTVAYIFKAFPNGFLHLVRDGDVPLGIPCEKIPGDFNWLGLAQGKLVICYAS